MLRFETGNNVLNKLPNLLAIDTATEACSVALASGAKTYARFTVAGRTHTQTLFPMVDEVMREAKLAFDELDGIVCGVGPGSFAGVRIGVGYAKGLALALDVPVVPSGSLALLAQAAIDQGAEVVLASIDARMDEVYFAVFEKSADGLAVLVGNQQVCRPQDVAVPATIVSARGVGTGWGRYPEELGQSVGCRLSAIDGAALPDVRFSLTAAESKLRSGEAGLADLLTPVYLRQKVALTLEEQIELRQSRVGSPAGR